jgi:phage tail-like protein
MARSSKVDAVEKFRFSVIFFNNKFGDPNTLESDLTGVFVRAGFSEITLPKQTTTAIEYRENVDPAHPQLGVGLTRYDPITLKRGVTGSSDFFKWASRTHDSTQTTSIANQRDNGNPFLKAPGESTFFRRDVLIIIYGRGGSVSVGEASNIPFVATAANVAGAAGLSVLGIGDVVKGIYLKDAWVCGFKPGDTLSATDDQTKLIEELDLRYESFEEITPESLLDKLNSIAGAIGGLALEEFTSTKG